MSSQKSRFGAPQRTTLDHFNGFKRQILRHNQEKTANQGQSLQEGKPTSPRLAYVFDKTSASRNSSQAGAVASKPSATPPATTIPKAVSFIDLDGASDEDDDEASVSAYLAKRNTISPKPTNSRPSVPSVHPTKPITPDSDSSSSKSKRKLDTPLAPSSDDEIASPTKFRGSSPAVQTPRSTHSILLKDVSIPIRSPASKKSSSVAPAASNLIDVIASSESSGLPPLTSSFSVSQPSQRTFRHGEPIVLGSDDSGSDSDSLPDANELLGLPPVNRTPDRKTNGHVSQSSPLSALSSPTDPNTLKQESSDDIIEHWIPQLDGAASVPTRRSVRSRGAAKYNNWLTDDVLDGVVNPDDEDEVAALRIHEASTKHKFSLKTLLRHSKQQKDREKAEEEASAVDQDTRAREEKLRTLLEGDGKGQSEADVERLLLQRAELVDDPEEKARLLAAVRRADTKGRKRKWSFFKPGYPQLPKDWPREGPGRSLGCKIARKSHKIESCWTGAEATSWMRRGDIDLALLAGFIDITDTVPDYRDRLLHISLSSDITSDREAALRCLASKPECLVNVLDVHSQLADLFDQLGAKSEAIDRDITLFERDFKSGSVASVEDDKRANWDALAPALALIRLCISHMTTTTLADASMILCRLLLDTKLQGKRAVMLEAQATFAALLETVSKCQAGVIWEAWKEMNNSMLDLQARLTIIQNIPAASVTLCQWRRMLAIEGFFGRGWVEKACRESDDSTIILHCPLRQFTSKISDEPGTFTISSNTEFTNFRARIQLLDIAVADGYAWMRLKTPTDPKKVSQEFLAPSKEKRNDLDNDIDALAEQLRLMQSSIIDTGASHASRADTKDDIERLRTRLLYSVRTRPPPKQDLWGQIEREEIRGREFMAGFLSKGKA